MSTDTLQRPEPGLLKQYRLVAELRGEREERSFTARSDFHAGLDALADALKFAEGLRRRPLWTKGKITLYDDQNNILHTMAEKP